MLDDTHGNRIRRQASSGIISADAFIRAVSS